MSAPCEYGPGADGNLYVRGLEDQVLRYEGATGAECVTLS